MAATPSSCILLLFPCLLLAALVSAEAEPPAAASGVVSRISFGSCALQSSPMPIWKAVRDFDPQLFIWLGDNVYGDNKRPLRLVGPERTVGPWKNVPRFYPSSQEEMARRYQLAKSHPDYTLLQQTAKVIGTWDDHDFGLNDAGKEFAGKIANQQLLLDFLDEPQDSPRRTQPGVYASYVYGPKGKQVKVILLDTRYHRDPLFSDGSLLGESQWEWLERELNGPETEITIIGSSIQVISNLSATGSPIIFMECWGHFPKERERLYKLIRDSKRNGVFFISGDIHFGEITRYDCGIKYPLFDITSSGLNRGIEEEVPRSLAIVLNAILWTIPSTMRVFSPHCRHRSCTYAQPNFGAIEIDWNAAPPNITVELNDVNGNLVSGVQFLLSELQPSGTDKTPEEQYGYRQHCSLETELPWLIRHRLALTLIGALAVVILAAAILVQIVRAAGRQLYLKPKHD